MFRITVLVAEDIGHLVAEISAEIGREQLKETAKQAFWPHI